MNKKFTILLIVFLLMITLPYLISTRLVDESYHFNGFLINPIDGHSYLAKMQQGIAGDWLFTLPYTSHPGEGVFLFTYYIFLGHIAGLLQVSNIIIFHLARLINAIALFFVLKLYYDDYLDKEISFYALVITLFGSGFGWIALAFGWVNSDFHIPEMYPFLSSIANPHFPLAIALMLIILRLNLWPDHGSPKISFTLSILLLIIQPFCMVIIIGIVGLKFLINIKQIERVRIISLASLVFPSVLYGVYLFIVIRTNSAIQNWNNQNITPSPAFWDLLIALGPMLIPSVMGIYQIIKRKESKYYPLIIWFGMVLVMAYLPLNLQRRFLIGLYIPICLLGVVGLKSLAVVISRKIAFVKKGILVTALPSNVILIVLAIFAVTMKEPPLVTKMGVWNSFNWINDHFTNGNIILSSHENGLFLPAYTNQRVIYGHPFETVDADKNKYNVDQYFNDMPEAERNDYVKNAQVDYILIDDHIPQLTILTIEKKYPLIYENDDVKIFQITK